MAPSMRPGRSASPPPTWGCSPRPEPTAPRDALAGMLAHDLRTPLAALSMNLDFALAELAPDAGKEVRSALEDCRASSAHAIRMIGYMADAVLLASGRGHPTFAEVDVQWLVADAVRRAAPDAAARGVRMVWSSPPARVRADPELLVRAIDAVLERALRHACPGGSIDVTTREKVLVVRLRFGAGREARREEAEAATGSLAALFAEAALRAQGGALLVEIDAEGSLLFALELPR